MQVENEKKSKTIDDVKVSNISSLNNNTKNSNNTISKAKDYNRSCNCCSKRYNTKSGWEFVNGRAKNFSTWFGISKFREDPKYYVYCSMKCASQCGPYE